MKNLKLKNQFPVEHSLLNIEHFSSIKVNARLRAFTLIELITVMSILTFLIATAVGAYFAWNQTSALRGAADLTLAGLNRARQHAITQRVDTSISFAWTDGEDARNFTNNMFFVIATNGVHSSGETRLFPIGPRQDLPRNIVCQISPNDSEDGGFGFAFYFKPNGRPYDWDGNRFEEGRNEIHLHLDRGGDSPPVRIIQIDPLTGIARP